MILGFKVLALITARSGSKGLPGKNIRSLCGRPLIQWSINTALACEEIDAVVVSTDDEQIAALAASGGAEVPFLRPSALAADSASSIDVVIHALDVLKSNARVFDIVLLLEPTSPLREVGDIQLALQRMLDMRATSIVSVCQAEAAHPAFMFRTTGEGRLEAFMPALPNGLRRQDIEPLFYPEGSFYISTVKALRDRRSFYHEDTILYVLPKWKALEIDDIFDFQIVEAVAYYRGLS